MRRFSISTAVAFGLASLAVSAFAESWGTDDAHPRLMNARIAEERQTRASRLGTSDSYFKGDTTWVGYNPAYAGSNYWSIGVGNRRPRGTTGPNKGDVVPVPDEDTGYWDWEHPIHGDTLQGWWPMRHQYHSFFIANLNDKFRPWHAIDIGNSISYVINQGPGNRRTYGVTSAWHGDPGVTGKVEDPGQSDANPKAPRWTPISGSMSAWCGLRGHGDVTAMDPVTGNPYNADALREVFQSSPSIPTGPGWTNYRFPGYADQWDQMLYRDIDISDTTVALSAAPLSVTFSYRTRMSTGKGVNASSRTGWFDKDPLAVVAGNFISSSDANLGAPIDSFMVYVGAPVADTAGAEWLGSDLATHQVFDPVRRWFGELIRANEPGGHFQLHTTYGNDPPITSPADSNAVRTVSAARDVTYGELRAAWGDRIRLVFRVKTNRGFSDDTGSLTGAYHSGGLGAAQVDDVSINLGGGPVALGGFENFGDIDNSAEASPLDFWKTSSKPPAPTHHVHDLADLIYEDMCGPPGSVNRACDLSGNVISQGDHDLGESFNGPFGTAEQEHFQGFTSPTINLAFQDDDSNPETVEGVNNMGLDSDTAVAAGNYLVGYHMYTGGYDLSSLGSSWLLYAEAYPAIQADGPNQSTPATSIIGGTRTWVTMRGPRINFFNPGKECFRDVWNMSEFGQLANANPGGIPDSVRVGLRKFTMCWAFGLTTNCGTTLGGYLDIMSFGIVDASPTPLLTVSAQDLWNDTFPATETAGLPGTAAFDTTTALIKTGRNTASGPASAAYVVPGDSVIVAAPGDSVEVQLVFRILPGPGNYVIPGDRCSGLRRVPSDSARITPGDGSFWTEYIENPGKDKDDMPTTGDCKGGGTLLHDQRWSELTWCNARCDTVEQNLFPIQARASSYSFLGGPDPGSYASMYHEDDKHLAALGISRHECFLVDTLGPVNNTNITCSSVPSWVTGPGKGYDGNPTTVEGTKILPDGLLTPGSHVEYFFVKKDLATGGIVMSPDTNVVYPQPNEQNAAYYPYASLDGHRWQQFSVLPDAWKFAAYGGLGKACMLFVDWADGLGEERSWVSAADSIGATSPDKRGAHNGWSAPGGADINDPAYFVNKNAQPGTTWDMYGVKNFAGYLFGPAGSLGARLAYRAPGTLLDDKWAKNAPTLEMMAAYYRILWILTGDVFLGGLIFGPYDYNTQDDTEFIRQFVTDATASDHRGLWCMGSYLVLDLDWASNTVLQGLLGVSLRSSSFMSISGNYRTCVDLIPAPVITTNGDIYGIQNRCFNSPNVLTVVGDAQPASYFDPAGSNPLNAPYVASVFQDAETIASPDRHYQSLTDAFSLGLLQSRLCDTSVGRLAYVMNVFTSVFGKICSVAGAPQVTLDVPGNADGGAFVNLAGVGNNPLRAGSAVIHLSLAQADRVTVKIYDVSGRLVRTLADGQTFKAGRVDPALTWDGLDDGGRGVARGAYFVSVRYEKSRFETAKKMIVLR